MTRRTAVAALAALSAFGLAVIAAVLTADAAAGLETGSPLSAAVRAVVLAATLAYWAENRGLGPWLTRPAAAARAAKARIGSSNVPTRH